ncbi:hypothetical protein VOLCADRAFT_96881 [Volvox carteri f. nagariensis]|uniref:Uncharacterized protein n=1 Tax=Volvox carteri f. nagariensis TaxID=3068 RepID=D8UBJ7_VOLCA|nr:uncharacterized protein VOLCADRAFT_96881 [Volvox carteri f. nagariensis]EFJ42956.1 hypothetical protein VOLCADRAFT_96881 [Volvox carteri f. nagariensis]|eukprot:XP_002955996.1 hypothetical protein VOLCADRAFT_96881 [Volvox carteri f. nagariensis]
MGNGSPQYWKKLFHANRKDYSSSIQKYSVDQPTVDQDTIKEEDIEEYAVQPVDDHSLTDSYTNRLLQSDYNSVWRALENVTMVLLSEMLSATQMASFLTALIQQGAWAAP